MKTLKRITTLLLAVMLLSTMALSLASCSTRVRGTYSTGSENYMNTTFVFEGKKVTKSQTFTYNESTSNYGTPLTGKYDISYEGAKVGYEITFIWDDAGKYAGKSEEERTETFAFMKTNTYIKIGDTYYYKQADSHEDHDH